MNKNHKKFRKEDENGYTPEEQNNMVVGRLGQGMCVGMLIGSTLSAGTGDVLLITGAGIFLGGLLGVSIGVAEGKMKKKKK